jgi:ubiquinone/menaquinone biosynthesis C-methylase UbiE
MPDKATIAAYDAFAEEYDESVIDFWNNFPKDFIDAFTKETPGKRVLDLGSGSGRDACLLRDRGLEIICADGSKSMIKLTAELGFESHLCDFLNLPFENDSFDGVWAYTSLIHIPRKEAAVVLRHVRALLKPDGTFVFGAIQGESNAEIVTHNTMPGAERYFRFYQPDELETLVTSCGFTLITQSTYTPHRKTYIQQLYQRTK